MRFTQLFTKTRRETPTDETSVNAQLLTRGGFVFKNLAGVWSLLPLGVRVIKKIEQIIREEMEAIGGQELHLNILQDKALWQKTGRWEEAKEVMYQFTQETSDKRQVTREPDVGLGFTHEEVVAQIAAQYIQSYKDLPKYVYQIQTKFRNEPRVQGGLLRGREFGMKDLYSLTTDTKQLDEFYERCAQAYLKIFKRLGLDSIRTEALGGLFSKRSDEFQVIADVGEDTIYWCPKCGYAFNKEIFSEIQKSKIKNQNANAKFKIIECPQSGDTMQEHRAIEVGNIFKLGTRFSEPLGLFFTDKDGTRKPVIMGSYGIGTGRAMGTVVEVHHDERGVVWPESVAPYQVHLITISKKADDIYQKLRTAGIEVIFDDRDDVSPGEKFADADLIGCPYRVVLSGKTGDKVEVKRRSEDKTELIKADELIKNLDF